MTTSPLIAALLCLLALLLLRAFCGAALGCMLSRNARKAYREAVPLWQRWLMLRAHEFVKDRYSKLEKRVLPNKALARFHRAAVIAMHALLPAAWAMFGLCAVGVLDGVWGDRVLTGYLAMTGAWLLLTAIADEIVHRQFWRMKRR